MPARLGRVEFVALMAMMFATIAFSIDAMLPALPEIADDLTPEAPNRAQLVLTSFVFGMGLGTLFSGPLSDAFGRRPVIFAGAALYVLGALAAMAASSLEMLLAARVLQGLGAAGPRVVALAIVRDLYEGRAMAQLMSFVMMVFALFPAVAPLIGAQIIAVTGWQGIFGAFVLFSGISVAWLGLRQRETLPPARRRPFRLATIRAGLAEVLSNRPVVVVIGVLSLVFGMLFGVLSSTQPIFETTFGRGEGFPAWFAVIAVLSAGGSVLNARLVLVHGMRKVAAAALLSQVLASAAMVALALAAPWQTTAGFALYILWTTSVFFMVGLVIGNLNALAMLPMGHVAGLAASVIGAISTVLGVAIAIPIGLAFDGTPLPAAAGVLLCAALSWILVSRLRDPEAQPVRPAP